METVTIPELLKKYPKSSLRKYEDTVSIQHSKAVIFTDLTLDEYREAKENEDEFILEKLPAKKGKKSSGPSRPAYRLQMEA